MSCDIVQMFTYLKESYFVMQTFFHTWISGNPAEICRKPVHFYMFTFKVYWQNINFFAVAISQSKVLCHLSRNNHDLCTLCRIVLQFIPNFYKYFRDTSDETPLKELTDFFQRLEKVIQHHGENSFFGGVEKPGAADYLLWPWIERTQALKLLSPGKIWDWCH